MAGLDDPKLRRLVKDFAPGFLDEPESDTIQGGATPDAKNGYLYSIAANGIRRAVMGKRAGMLPLHTSSLVDLILGVDLPKVEGLFDFRRSTAAAELLAACNGKLWQYDNLTAFTQVGVTTPFATGVPVRAAYFKDNAFFFDGTTNQRYDGTAFWPLGQVAPTSAPGLAAAVGPGVTGEYEGYAVWYDVTMDHESSPSAIATSVTLTNQQRQWSIPSGTPGSNYGYWRIYCRRVDTYEFNFFKIADVPIATLTYTEGFIDAARRIAGLGPFTNEHNVPPVFAMLEDFGGFGIGVAPNSSDFYATRQGDFQSVNPANRFGVGRGDGEFITTARPYGDSFLIQKPHRTWEIVGTALPFTIKQVHSNWGNVSQESAVEANKLYYAWDREKGPYVTDKVNFTSLANGQIRTIVRRVNRLALANIRAAYYERDGLIIWSIPLDTDTRTRTLLIWHIDLQCWLPPQTGLEWASFANFTNPNTGLSGLYVGDEWGRVYQMFTGRRDGVLPNVDIATLHGTIDTATVSTFGDLSAAFPTTGDGLAGSIVVAISPTGIEQWRRIRSNTATQINIDVVNGPPFSPIPTATWTYIIGGIEWYWWTAVADFDLPEVEKQFHQLFVQLRALSSTHQLRARCRINDSTGDPADSVLDFDMLASGAIWDFDIWDVAVWAGAGRYTRALRILRSGFTIQVRLSNYWPDEEIQITAYGITADPLPGKRASGK